MTAPFQPERSESSLSSAPTGNGLNTEFANLIQSTQRSSADNPPVLSADGSQMVIPPVSQTDGSQAARQQQSSEQQVAGSQQSASEQQPQSVAYNPSLCVPSWQRFSPTPVATDGTMMPADGPGSPGDPGPGPAIPMWMRFAPPGLLKNQQQQADQNNAPSNELASQNALTTGGDGTLTQGNGA